MTLRFQEIFLTEPHFVMSGAYEARVQSGQAGVAAYPCLFNLLYHQVGVDALAKWYRHDIHAAENQNIPIILSCPTLRANEQAIKLAGYKTPEGITKINADAIHFVRGLRDQFFEYAEGIFLCAPIEAKNSALSATTIPLSFAEAEDYHTAQVQAITAAKPDILFFTAMRALAEAQACASLAAKSGLTYGMGFTINRQGQLEDGTLLEDAISAIDAAVSPRPFFYVMTCTHSSVIKQVLRRNSVPLQRVLGMIANASAKPLVDCAKASRKDIDEPAQFVHALMALGEQYRLKIFGGCCGIDERYFSLLCERIGRKNKRDRESATSD